METVRIANVNELADSTSRISLVWCGKKGKPRKQMMQPSHSKCRIARMQCPGNKTPVTQHNLAIQSATWCTHLLFGRSKPRTFHGSSSAETEGWRRRPTRRRSASWSRPRWWQQPRSWTMLRRRTPSLPTRRRREQREGVPCCYGGEDGMATSGSPREMGRWRKPQAAKGKSGYGGWTNRHPFLG